MFRQAEKRKRAESPQTVPTKEYLIDNSNPYFLLMKGFASKKSFGATSVGKGSWKIWIYQRN